MHICHEEIVSVVVAVQQVQLGLYMTYVKMLLWWKSKR